MEDTRIHIFALGGEIETYLAAEWRSILDENSEKLADAWQRAGEMAYGTYLDLLYRPVHRWLKESGLRAVPKLPGEFEISREWGDGPDETDQQRWMWSTIETMEGTPVGTIVTITPHDHTQFRIPRAPGVVALAETGKDAVVDALCRRSPEFAAAREASIEIAEYMASLEG
jgi:hypothetical protein